MSGGFGQPSTDPTSGWARVQLVRGQSGGASWAIDSQYAEARLSIGSAPDAGWPVQGIGVMPVHFELFWDGRSLWIADTRRVGGVAVNGRTIQEWVQLRGRVEVSFGSAGMVIETSEAPVLEMASNPGHATRVTLAPEMIDKRGTGSMNIARLTEAPGESWDPLPDEKTRIAQAPSERPQKHDLDPETTRIASGAMVPGLPPPGLGTLSGVAPKRGDAAGVMRPRLGGAPQGSPAAPPPREMARTLAQENMSPHVAEATRIAASLADQTGPPSVMLADGYPSAAPMSVTAPPSAPVAPASASLLAAGPGGGPAGGFAAPPTFDQAHAAQQKPGTAAAGEKGKQALPTRTWILLAVTVLAAVGLMMMGPREVEEEAAAPQATGVPGPLPAAAGTGAGTGSGSGTGTATGTGTGATGTETGTGTVAGTGTGTGTATGAEPVAVDVSPIPVPVPVAPAAPVTGPTEDRIAADLVISGRWDEALPRYQALAAQHPERPEYAQMVRILQRRLSNRCQGGIGPDGRPCSP